MGREPAPKSSVRRGSIAVSKGHVGVGWRLPHHPHKEPPLMNESVRTTVKCQDPGDGSGDVIIDLHDDILERMGLNIGDSLTIELIDGTVMLKPIRDADAQS